MTENGSEKPPFLGSWKNVYILLMANLGLCIVLFYLLTLYFS